MRGRAQQQSPRGTNRLLGHGTGATSDRSGEGRLRLLARCGRSRERKGTISSARGMCNAAAQAGGSCQWQPRGSNMPSMRILPVAHGATQGRRAGMANRGRWNNSELIDSSIRVLTGMVREQHMTMGENRERISAATNWKCRWGYYRIRDTCFFHWPSLAADF